MSVPSNTSLYKLTGACNELYIRSLATFMVDNVKAYHDMAVCVV